MGSILNPPQTRCDYLLNEAIKSFAVAELKVLLCFSRHYDRILAVVNKAGELKLSLSDAVLKNSIEKNIIKTKSKRVCTHEANFFLLLSASTSTTASFVVS